MKRLFVVVEGQTEEEFVKDVLGPHLQASSVFAIPIIVTTRRDEFTGAKLGKGGGGWRQWTRDLRILLGKDSGADVAFTTLIDLYRLPRDFPRLGALSTIADTSQRAAEVEQEMSAQFNDSRFIPYVQRHEFEALVLAGLDELARLLDSPDDVRGLERLRSDIASQAPEDINDGPDTAPSKRLAARIPSYRKTVHGPLVVDSVGLARLRAVCPRFNGWVSKLEAL